MWRIDNQLEEDLAGRVTCTLKAEEDDLMLNFMNSLMNVKN